MLLEWLDWSHKWKKNPFMSRKHNLALLRFSQRYENWTIDDWKRVIFNHKTKMNRLNSNGGPCFRLEMQNTLDLNMSITP